MKKYDHKQIEEKWQKEWERRGMYKAVDGDARPKFYPLVEFPFPSGAGLHTGHVRSYTAMDIVSRKRRMQGENVMYPIGWDAFGLPTENYAIKTGIQPAIVTKQNTDNFRRQLKSMGLSFDWSREVDTSDPKYFKWTQWIFLKMHENGLAYKAKSVVNWCPKDKTVLANEEVIDGKCERCGTPVEKREKEQWMLAITKYADRLYDDLDTVDFLERIKVQQRNWIGRSEGAEIDFRLDLAKKPRFLLIHGYEGGPDQDFFPWLRGELEARGHEVIVPSLPHPNDPKEREQVDRVLADAELDEDTVVIGHSLGAIVAMKAILKAGKKISGLVLVAAAMDPKSSAKPQPYQKGFDWDIDFDRVRELASGKVAVVSDLREKQRVAYLRDIARKLSAALIEVESNEEHFTAAKEPALLSCVTPQVTVFTTRPDTLYGVTYLVLAPEHEWVGELLSRIENRVEVEAYVAEAKKRSVIERTNEAKEKTGVELAGVRAINPANGEPVPVWIADYVLGDYGTGAVMAVPAHDERDFAFANRYGLPIKRVIDPKEAQLEEGCYTGDGILVASGKFDGMTSEDARKKVTEAAGGRWVRKFKLRDWIFSRQRYWGEPIPMVHCDACGWQPVPEKDLPVTLPAVERYEPTDTGESPLAAIEDWVRTTCPHCGGPARRETDTMPNWAGSSWYYLRYADPRNDRALAGRDKLDYWTPVDWYNGGMEHTTLHLLYSRFWHKFLYDIGVVPTTEPYKKRTSHGMILAEGGEKMSKSKGNVVNPDDLVSAYGADTLRVYEMFMGPFDQAIAWDTQSLIGPRRFIERVYAMGERLSDDADARLSAETDILLNKTIIKVTADIEEMGFNTAISSLMILLNAFEKEPVLPRRSFGRFLQILAPFAPHVTEELWHDIGGEGSIHASKWPVADESKLADETVTIVVQVNGKVRASFPAKRDAEKVELEKTALSLDEVKRWTGQGTPKKVVIVPGKLVSIVL